MLQTLVVGGAKKDLRIQSAASVPIKHHLIAPQMVAIIGQHVGDLANSHLIIERGRIPLLPLVGTNLAQKTLNQVPNRHPARNRMRVDDDIRRDPLRSEGHIFLPISDPTRALLPMATGKLVANLRDADRSHPDLGELAPLRIRRNHHLIHNPILAGPQKRRAVSLGKLLQPPPQLILVGRQWRRFPNNRIIPTHADPRRDEPITVQLVIRAPVPHRLGALTGRHLKRLLIIHPLFPLLVSVRPEKTRPEKAAINRRLVHNHRILLVVASVARNRHNRIDARRKLPKVQILHRARRHQRLLRIVQNMRQRIHPHLVVGDVDPHRLLPHRRLVRVSRRLVVVRERDDGGTHAENHRRVDLTVGVSGAVGWRCFPAGLQQRRGGRAEIFSSHGNHAGFLLLRVDKLNHTSVHQVGPAKVGHLLLLQALDLLLADQQPLVFHNKQRPTTTPALGE
eukprot:Sdes_comp10388_c0_seq1m2045